MTATTMDRGRRVGRHHLRSLRHLLPYLWPTDRPDLRARVIIAAALLIMAKLANIYVPILLRNAVDALEKTPENLVVALPLGLLLAYGIARITALAFSELRDALFAKVAQHAIRQVALETFRHLLALSLRFHLERRTGGLSRALDRGAKSIEFLLFFVMFNVLPTIFEILLVCGILWYLFDWHFAAVPFLTVLAYVWLTFRLTEWRIKHRRQMNESDNDANTKVIDALINFETVKYFGNDRHEGDRYDDALRCYEDAAVRSRTSLSVLNSSQAVVIGMGIMAMMIMAATGVVAGTMTVGDFVMINAYLIQISMPLNLLGTVYREIKQSLIDLEALFTLLHRGAEVEDKKDAIPLRAAQGEVHFENVVFGYDSRRPILKDVSFRVPAGKTVAIVGPSGAGKSTISRILFRFYDVFSGQVTIDGQDVRDVTQDSLRAAIGIVPQDTVLFNDTIFYNIAYGRPGASRDEVEEVARLARIDEFIAGLPDGYETMVGERGLKLSGGEKQRVAIARTMLKSPSILLFDEATSALDSKTEQEIQQSLREVSQGHTTLIIAHRLSTVIEADEILVLEAGAIVERGRHDSLLLAGGAYAQMWDRQQKAAEREAASEPSEAAR
ncbi:MAG: ABC transporter ATP-binding protein/permease [Pseudomonadota bacterium]